MNTEERLEVFKAELDVISDNRIKEFTKLCIASGPDYFFSDCPASTTGKYHPLNEISWDGTIIHTKRVFNVAYSLCRGLGVEHSRDPILCACIVHDLVKKGWKGSQWSQKNHPQLAAELIASIQKDTQLLTAEEFKIVYGSVYYHYGPWAVKATRKPMSEYTMEELCVYTSDYVASKRFIDVQYKDLDHE